MIKEIKIEEPIAAQLAEFYELQNKIENLSEELENMEKKYKKFSAQLAPMFETMKELKETTAEAESYIIKVNQEGYERKNHKYKKAYVYALSKLNEATREVCRNMEEDESTISKIAARFSIEKIEEASTFDKVQMFIRKITSLLTKKVRGYFTTMDKANQVLEKLASKAESKSTSNPLDEQGTTPQTLPDVDRLTTKIEQSPSIKSAVKYINTRPELVKAIASIMRLLGKELQPGRISAGTVTTDLKTALKTAGYK